MVLWLQVFGYIEPGQAPLNEEAAPEWCATLGAVLFSFAAGYSFYVGMKGGPGSTPHR